MKKIRSKLAKVLFKLKLYKRHVLFFLIIIFFVSLFFSHKLVIISNIICKSDSGECPVEISDNLEKYEGERLVSTTKGVRDYLEANATIKDFALYYKFPNWMEVNIVVKKARFALKNKNLDWIALVASDRSVTNLTQETDLPLLVTEESVANPGHKVSQKEFFAMNIIHFLDTYYSFNSAFLENDKLIVKVQDDLEIIFPTKADKKVLLGGVSLILSRLNSWRQNSRIEEGYSYQIDMSYENPIIKKL